MSSFVAAAMDAAMDAILDLSTKAVVTLLAVLATTTFVLYKMKPGLFTADNFFKLLDFVVKVLEKVFAMLEVVKKIVDIALEIKEAYDKIRDQEKPVNAQWRSQVS